VVACFNNHKDFRGMASDRGKLLDPGLRRDGDLSADIH
jgi:hypothetical protein